MIKFAERNPAGTIWGYALLRIRDDPLRGVRGSFCGEFRDEWFASH